MDFSLSTEHRDFAASIGHLLQTSDVPGAIRSWSAGEHGPGLKLWQGLANLGVSALAVSEEHEGAGADAVDLTVAFEVLGYYAVPGPIVESFAAIPGLLRSHDALAERWLPAIARGESVATLAMLPHTPFALDADVADLRLVVGSDGAVIEGARSAPERSVDAARRLFRLEPHGQRAIADAGAAFDAAALASAAQLLGLGQRILDDTVAYAKQRHQYGKPIGQYQAIKHLLADCATALELARPLVHGAAVAMTSGTATCARDVSAARVAAAAAAYRIARTGLQVHGAIGYTAEHDLGQQLTKVFALQCIWGTQAFHRDRVLRAVTSGAA
ncbi:acyl-CoA dehydrogenase family protein [Hoyosella subflava]|uniref:Acyl-CoA dehydrogenase domain protein n=1 Tax=Hoyosella subflava (strain DSM 45089 / JCM 17490 / NBRC 109087 / DQS3-9A1) TaxID=443218 RepID=F6EN76_HOYSD|nr:acyl-CoA dehydrogenase family protein [Hoyosella subflava]AEF39393.1 Acyl-CoA dehydrogenase domain protein [Hoyosella subflava DQS3-9A1]